MSWQSIRQPTDDLKAPRQRSNTGPPKKDLSTARTGPAAQWPNKPVTLRAWTHSVSAQQTTQYNKWNQLILKILKFISSCRFSPANKQTDKVLITSLLRVNGPPSRRAMKSLKMIYVGEKKPRQHNVIQTFIMLRSTRPPWYLLSNSSSSSAAGPEKRTGS